MDTDGFQLETFIDHCHNDDDNDDEVNVNASSKTKKRSKARIIRSVWFNKETDPEKHYPELVMLFTAWRNEEVDLLGPYSSYQEQYNAISKAINEQMKQYTVCNEDLNEIQQQINTLEESYDTIAPYTQNVEQQDQADGDADLHPDFNASYNLSDDIGIPSAELNAEPLILNEMQDDEYRYMIQSLNREQKKISITYCI